MSVSGRSVALEAVRRVTDEGAYSNLVLSGLLDRSNLSSRDRALATELTYGTLRRLLALDVALGVVVDRPLRKAPPLARAALRLGAYQIMFTRIPGHAAVAATVGLVPTRQRGFVNAVLRRLVTEELARPEGDGDESIAVRTGLAPWAVGELRRLLGSEAEAAASALSAPATLTLRANPCRADPGRLSNALSAAGLTAEPGRFHGHSLRVRGGHAVGLPGFGEGWFAVQDEASAWVVDVLDPQGGELVLDVCAGPGGKAADIACRAGKVVAGDVSESRTGLIGETAARLGVRVLSLVQDASAPGLKPIFDRVLVDAPCSGIGAARRRPELLWRPERRNLSGLARLQVRLAAGAASLLRPGGILVYSVCTFPRAETDAACDALLNRVPFLRPDPFVGPDGRHPRARLWPHRHGTDAMFVARFRRLH